MPHSSSSSPKRRAYARMAASTASTCLRSEGDSVHSQKRDQASGRESSCDMVGPLAQLPGRTDVRPSPSLPPLMEKLVIEGGVPLSGTVVPAGNKNAALPLLAACLLTEEQIVLHNVPRIRDTEALMALLEDLGVKIERRDGNTVALHADAVTKTDVDPALAERIRASFLVAGPLLARFGEALLPPPGGDVIGRRRLDPHLDAFRALGAHVEHGRDIRLRAPDQGLQACDFFMDEPSVMGTENALMAAALTPGSTVIRNAASEPHVQDLARLLLQMGARIEGIGSNVLIVHGSDKLGGADYTIGQDYIEVGSFVALAAVTGGELRIRGAANDDLRMTRMAFDRLRRRVREDG